MKTSKDSYSIDILLRHSSHSPEIISAALSLKPVATWRVGENLVKVRAKRSFFYARLHEGTGSSSYERALKHAYRFLRKNASFLDEFKGGSGQVELILNHTVGLQEEEGDKSFELHIAPAFLTELAARGIGLRVQGCQQGAAKAREPDAPRKRAGRSAPYKSTEAFD